MLSKCYCYDSLDRITCFCKHRTVSTPLRIVPDLTPLTDLYALILCTCEEPLDQIMISTVVSGECLFLFRLYHQCSGSPLHHHAINPKKGHSMLTALNNKIDHYARGYERLVLDNKGDEWKAHERWGKLLGLCMAKAMIMDDDRTYMDFASDALARARGDVKLTSTGTS